eukprot:SAG22_NODE_5634_length_979_cov_1.348864_1_plen_106_part_10
MATAAGGGGDELAVDVLVDFRDAGCATVRLFAADIAPAAAAAAAAAGTPVKLVWRPYIQPLLELPLCGAAAAGGYLAVLKHSKLSRFGQLSVRLTPPQHDKNLGSS